jgi:hypothetical protein
MVDYTKTLGEWGTSVMMLRDTGTIAEFWLKSGPLTRCYGVPWGYTANGVTNHNLRFDYPVPETWRRIGTLNIVGSQNVNFWIGETYTRGFDGPASLSGYFQRSTVPPKPINLRVINITNTTCSTQFSSGGSGGSPVDQWLMTYSTRPEGGTWTLASDGTNHLTGLTPGQQYWFWARGHNALGWGPWSSSFSWTQLRVPFPPSAPIISNVTQNTATASWTPNGTGGSPITNYELHYRTTLQDEDNTTILSGNPPKNLIRLTPGVPYHFWTRAQNIYGWSAFTGPVTVKMIAGALIKVETVYKDAVPYINVDGVWKLARPWGKSNKDWKESQ